MCFCCVCDINVVRIVKVYHEHASDFSCTLSLQKKLQEYEKITGILLHFFNNIPIACSYFYSFFRMVLFDSFDNSIYI